MTQALRKLNDSGISHFRRYIAAGASGEPPVHLLSNPATSDPLPAEVQPDRTEFADRFEFGVYLCELLRPLDVGRISHDQGLWSALGLFWFDQLCPARGPGLTRRPDKEYRYILSPDYRHFYRHLVRSPWYLVHNHGEHARCLLISPRANAHPLSVGGEILEQIGSRQSILSSSAIVEVISELYFDHRTGRPKRGAAGAGAGSARRLGIVLRQLDLNYDPELMPGNGLMSVLPREFERWTAQTDS